MNFSTEMIRVTGKVLAKEMKQSGFSSEDNLYDVENGMRELLGEIGKAGLAEFLEEEDDELHEEQKASDCKNDYYFHSYRPAVIWSVFGKIKFERRYYRYKNPKKGEKKGFARLDQKMGFRAGEVSPSLAELLALEGVSTPFEEAAKKIEKFLLFRISDNTLRKETERFGALQEEFEEELIQKTRMPTGCKNGKGNKKQSVRDEFTGLLMGSWRLC